MDWTINPYSGCGFACTFCFGRGLTRDADFATTIGAKLDAPARLRDQLQQLRRRGVSWPRVRVGSATDPYQPLERELRLTRALLEVLADHGGVHVEVCTRSLFVSDDLELLHELDRRGSARVCVGISSAPREVAVALEPGVPSARERLELVERLARAGLTVGVEASPLLPGLGDDPRAMRQLVVAALQAGAGYLRGALLRLPERAREAFLGWLAAAHPEQTGRYERLYRRRGPWAPRRAEERIQLTLGALRRQYRLPEALPWPARSAQDDPLADRTSLTAGSAPAERVAGGRLSGGRVSDGLVPGLERGRRLPRAADPRQITLFEAA
ncbi:MAG: radical SAM protein [Planctomycetota bacterium]